MADRPLTAPLPADALLVEHDPVARVVSARSGPAGPAGSALVDLGDGVEVDVDVADPGRLVALTVVLPVDGPPGEVPSTVRRRLDALLGPARSAGLVSLVHRTGGDGEERQVPGRAHPGRGEGQGSRLAAAVGRAALAQAAAARPGATRLVQVAGLLEAATARASLTPLWGGRGPAGLDARAGIELLVDLVDHGRLAVPGQRAADALAAELRRAVGLVGARFTAVEVVAGLAVDLERGRHTAVDVAGLAVDLERGPHTAVDAASLQSAAADPTRSGAGAPPAVAGRASGGPPRPPRPPGPLRRRVPVEVAGRPGDLVTAAVAGVVSGPCEIEVRIDGWAVRAHGLWARVFAVDDDTLLGLAPFGRDVHRGLDGHDAVCHVIVPPGAPGRVEVDITDRCELPRPSRAMAEVQRAIHLGVGAAGDERLGDLDRAGRRWRQCARAWDAVGDPRRGAQARAYARAAGRESEGGSGRIVGSLLSDLMAAPHPSRASGRCETG